MDYSPENKYEQAESNVDEAFACFVREVDSLGIFYSVLSHVVNITGLPSLDNLTRDDKMMILSECRKDLMLARSQLNSTDDTEIH
ncbi:hypothetical protein [Roseibium aggregatum]|uniref:hypothetical protein n=1 Tax=Roseibium aggregatum TaxID=187304 RepID=UPI001680AC26|nr:hypothetical protein [Roseibium aggregatum]